jgi:2,3-diketo-5-methylthiopentyl-1-phosphate enolase
MIDLDHFMLQEDPDIRNYVVGTYLLRKELNNPDEIIKLAIMMASEQTTGTWIQVPGDTGDLIGRFQGKVLNIWEVPDREQIKKHPEEPGTFIIQIAFPWENFGPQIPMLLTTIFGNISMIGDIKLLDIHFPKALVEGC